MPIYADSHVHSHHSGDSETPMPFQIESAIVKGINNLCFTEHMDIDFPYENTDLKEDTFFLNLETYKKEFSKMQDLYRGQIHLRFGIELGLQPHLCSELTDFIASSGKSGFEFDEIIGSTHVSDGMDPYYPCYFDGRTEKEAYRSYFRHSAENLEVFHDFDTYGHLDYIVRYGPSQDQNYSYEQYKDVIDPILEQLVAYGIALEVNTAALAKGMRNFNPTPSIVKRYFDMGGRMITIGSDAHVPEQIGYAFDRACATLKAIGVSEYVIFDKRKPSFHSL